MIFFVTGASGVGKSACLAQLRGLLRDVALHDFDEVGVPHDADKAWRQRTTEAWLVRAREHEAGGRHTVICGGAVLGEILACPSATDPSRIAVCFLDCSDETRIERMRGRGENGATQDTLNWAAWQRIHVLDSTWHPDVIHTDSAPEMHFTRWSSWRRGDARWHVETIDTTSLSIDEVASRVAIWVKAHTL